MKIAPLALLALAACATPRNDFAFPTADDLSAQTATPCPPLAQLTGELGDLAMKDKDAAVLYAQCQARHAAAVEAYRTMQARLLEAKTRAEKVKEPE